MAQLSIRDSSVAVTATTNLFAYRPRYADAHRSGLAVMFLNIEGIYPCVANRPYNPICRVFTDEDDGFRGGRAVVDSGDNGGTFRIFGGTSTATYGFAFQGCAEFNTTCFPNFHSFNVACTLPRSCDP